MVSSFVVVVVQPVTMVKNGLWPVEAVVYLFHLGASVTLICQFNGVPLRYHGVEVVVLLAMAGCFLLGVVLGKPGKLEKSSDVESTVTVCLEQLSLNKAHEKPDVANKASQKTLVNREASGSTLRSDNSEPEMVSKAMALNSLEDYCEHNWMSPQLDYSLVPLLNGPENSVHRLKLVSQLHVNKRLPKKRKWQLIHDEKVFLLSVSENLLPSVLKLSESPIQASKRSMENFRASGEFDGSPVRTQYHTPRASPSRESFEKAKSTFDRHSAILEGPDRHSAIMEGLEEIPTAQAPPWTKQGTGLRLILLQDWERNKQWFAPGSFHDGVDYENFGRAGESDKEDFDNFGKSRDEVTFDNFGKSRDEVNFENFGKSRDEVNFENFGKSRDEDFEKFNKSTEVFPETVDRLGDRLDRLTVTEKDRPSSILLGAPSLHTYRRNSEGSNRRLVYAQELLENALTHCVTPTARVPELPSIQSTNSSPIKRVMGMFRRRGLEAEFAGPNYSFGYHKHNDLVANSTISHPILVASGKSSSGLPRKAIKSFLKLHKSGSSFTYTPHNPPPVPPAPPPIPILFNMPKDPLFRHSTELMQPFRVPSDEWDMSEATALDQLRVSSLPSAIIGEYDKEKWRKLKELEEASEAFKAELAEAAVDV
ncbi:hypothetical protein C7M61_004491 [Candidozyma pseudohaemuli]|uniref:Uncharacterized protein n=1 Tax=Candidozyma pseudohaemuli TaxID=418784 RepID=A0A2P7YHL5_9ASCO|nr:hypothetical protein C7M61_004491 [[Candida] pseudohaemulonii]PSK35455.1 hypothetical protein C7M61_004491 [[Candida] pseudohaemulonii]